MKREPSLVRPLMLALTGAIILFWLGAIGLSIVVMRHELDEVFDSALQETAERLLALVTDDMELRTKEDEGSITISESSGGREYLTYQVRLADGTILLRSKDAPSAPFDVPLNAGFHDAETRRIYTAVSADGLLYLQAADRFSNRREAVRESAVTMLIPLAVLVPVSVLAIWLVVGRALRPIDQLRESISQKDGGNLAPLESGRLPKELKPITHSVNLLLQRLRAALDAEREFTANSAHELRTPLAGALAQTQRLLEELPSGGWKQRARNIEGALLNLVHLAEKLLQLARADSGIGTQTARVDIRDLLSMIVRDHERGFEIKGRVRYIDEAEAPLLRAMDVDAFGIVMRNLIENALVHGDPSKPVMVLIDNDGVIRVLNESAVVESRDLDRLKTRFQRGKTGASGSGLGLPIADRIVRQMGGVLQLYSPAAGRATGFEARITLPE